MERLTHFFESNDSDRVGRGRDLERAGRFVLRHEAHHGNAVQSHGSLTVRWERPEPNTIRMDGSFVILTAP